MRPEITGTRLPGNRPTQESGWPAEQLWQVPPVCHAFHRAERIRGAMLRVLDLLQRVDHLRYRLEQVGHESVVGDAENRRLLILINCDDRLRVLHPGQMLN